MISVILLIFTVILLVIGGIFGFLRGALKQGVRVVLWGILFFSSLFAIPWFTDMIFGEIIPKLNLDATTIEQLIELCLEKIEFLKEETVLILPLAELARSLVIPIVVIVLFCATGFISFIVYLITSVFLKHVTEEQKIISKVAGAILGIVVSLLAGSVTFYPLAVVEQAISEGDYDETLQKEFPEVTMLTNSYDDSAASKIYQYTGMEYLGKAVHNAVISGAVDKNTNIWTELPALVRLGNEGWKMYDAVSETSTDDISMQKQIPSVMEAYFALNFISDENQIHVLNSIKDSLKNTLGESAVSDFIDWLELQNKEQIVKDTEVYGKLYDILKQEGILDAMLTENAMPLLKAETVTTLLDTVYELSNANKVVPEALKLFSASAITNIELPIEITDIEWTEETKEELEEVVSIVYEYSDKLENEDEITEEEKEEIREALKELEDNSVINKDLLEELINSYEPK